MANRCPRGPDAPAFIRISRAHREYPRLAVRHLVAQEPGQFTDSRRPRLANGHIVDIAVSSTVCRHRTIEEFQCSAGIVRCVPAKEEGPLRHREIGRIRLVTVFALMGAFALAPGLARAEGCGEELRPLVEAKMAQLGVPGLIVQVEAPGLCHWIATLGTGDVAKRRPMSLDGRVRIGSITKTFTGTVVLQLVDEGRIGLDDPISLHLSGVPNGSAITIRQLLYMSSGLYNYSEDLAFNRSLDADPQRVWTPEKLLAIGFSQPPYFPPGAGFHYSNTNSTLLGRLVET